MTFSQTLPSLPMVTQVDSPAPTSFYWLSQCFNQCFDSATKTFIYLYLIYIYEEFILLMTFTYSEYYSKK